MTFLIMKMLLVYGPQMGLYIQEPGYHISKIPIKRSVIPLFKGENATYHAATKNLIMKMKPANINNHFSKIESNFSF